jgi:hypothetical protein
MSYSGSMSLSSFYMMEAVSTQAITGGLFEKSLTFQHVFHSESKCPALGGNTAFISSVSLRSDGDNNLPIARVSVLNADTISSMVGNQVTTNTWTSQRVYQSTNPLISTKSTIELDLAIFDSGDLVYNNQATFLILPIKD